MKKATLSIIIVGFIGALGVASLAFAHGYGGWGGWGGHMGYGPGYGMGPGMMGPGMMGYYGQGYGNYDQGYGNNGLTPEQSAKLQEARDQFYQETGQLRDKIADKQLEISNELNSAAPDKAKLANLQKELSGLQAEYGQKTLAYQLEMRKMLPQGGGPNYAYGYGYGGCGW